MREHEIFTLSNGIRCIYQHAATPAGHFGVILKAGSRYENDQQQGLSHFIEHCIFKGTQKRKPYHILNRLDAVGGELNAYTTKEEVCVYASFLREHLNRSVELIADILFNSVYPTKEVEKEKDIVIDEILSYKDTPSEQIFDDFESYVFKGHPLENNILGTEASVKSFDRATIKAYWQHFLHPDNIVLSVVGNYSVKRLQKMFEKYFAKFQLGGRLADNQQQWQYQPFDASKKESQYQVHTIIGSPACSYKDKRRRTMVLLNNILGGPSLNARLVLGIREKYGYTYNIESLYTPFTDAGIMQIYFGADPKFATKTERLVHKELHKLKTKKLGIMQLHQSKEQLKGQIALAQENKNNVMLSLGKSLLEFDQVDLLEDIYKDIDAITSENIMEISNEVFDAGQLSTLRFTTD